MKQVTMGIVLILFTGFSLYAQQWTTSGTNIYNGNTGSVGIGITAPIAKLHIKGTGTTNSSSSLLIQNSAGTDLLKTFDNGFIGIGTTITPLEKLHIQNGDLLISSNANTLNTVVGALKFSYNSWPASYAGIAGMTNGGGLDQLDLLFYTAYGTATEKMRIMSNSGFVGIGTAAPGAKLDVNGNIFCNQKIAIGTTDLVKIGTNSLAVNGTAIFTKAKVAIYATAWPDYVFSPNYKLPSLAEIEDFIKLNKHLPEVPTAAEVEKDGIDLGDNQTLLLKKIEELTLIVIEQNKKQESLQNIIIDQNKRIERLEGNSKGDIEK